MKTSSSVPVFDAKGPNVRQAGRLAGVVDRQYTLQADGRDREYIDTNCIDRQTDSTGRLIVGRNRQ